MKKFTNEIREGLHTLRTYMEEEPLAAIAILCAYIGDETAYEFFCDSIPENKATRYTSAGEVMRYDDNVFIAAELSGVFINSVPKFIDTALNDFGLWYHLLDGTYHILSDNHLAAFLPYQTRYIACGLLAQWEAKQLNEDNWYINFADLIAAYAVDY